MAKSIHPGMKKKPPSLIKKNRPGRDWSGFDIFGQIVLRVDDQSRSNQPKEAAFHFPKAYRSDTRSKVIEQ
jgi:hypothetical protein